MIWISIILWLTCESQRCPSLPSTKCSLGRKSFYVTCISHVLILFFRAESVVLLCLVRNKIITETIAIANLLISTMNRLIVCPMLDEFFLEFCNIPSDESVLISFSMTCGAITLRLVGYVHKSNMLELYREIYFAYQQGIEWYFIWFLCRYTLERIIIRCNLIRNIITSSATGRKTRNEEKVEDA